MGIYFRDILLTRISRGANNCGQHSLEKNIYFIMRFSPHFQLFYFNDRLEFCKFFEGKIKRINNADLFSQLPLLIFIKGANISGGHCILKNVANKTEKWFQFPLTSIAWTKITMEVNRNLNCLMLQSIFFSCSAEDRNRLKHEGE